MNNWNEGYFTDAAYTYGYYRELSPNFMRWCLLVNGIAAPEITADSCHCELGFGQGLSANIHAAATPGKFFGTDFLPAHAAQAQEFAEASGADAHFFEDSFEEFSKREDLPAFDSIGFHGVWTWISAENRQHVVEVARRHMKSGGMFYNSYNCLPGWAPNAPLRELLILAHEQMLGGNADERIQSAVKLVGDMLDAEPVYAKFAPSLRPMFDNVKNLDPHYIAHEYLNRDWDLMYFTDVAQRMQAAKLDFATYAAPIEGESFHLPKKAHEFLGKVGNQLVREQLLDYFINRQFRKDIYVRGLRRLSRNEAYEKILSMRYVLLTPAAEVSMKINTGLGHLNLTETNYRPFLQFLEEDNFRPKNVLDYATRNKMELGMVVEMIRLLIFANHVMPCQSEAAVKLVKKSCERLNAHICERAQVNAPIVFLASPLTGCGFPVNQVSQLFLAQYKSGGKTADKLAEAVRDVVLRREAYGGKPETPEETLPHLKVLAERFLSRDLPILKALLIA